MFLSNVEKYIKEMGIKPAEFERMCGLGNGTVRSWRNGNAPTLSTVERIAQATGVPVTEWVQ